MYDWYSLLMFGVAAVFLTVVVWFTVQGLNELKWRLYTLPQMRQEDHRFNRSREDTGEVQVIHPKEEVEECVE